MHGPSAPYSHLHLTPSAPYSFSYYDPDLI